MARENLVCGTCGGSGIVPDETRIECRAEKDKERRAALEKHLFGRQDIFQAIDTVLALDRDGYLSSGDPTVPSAILNVHTMVESSRKHWSEGRQAEAMICLTICAAEIVWMLEAEGFPTKQDLMAQWKVMKEQADESNGEDMDDE